MTSADRQLIDWYFAQPGRSTARDIAVGYLLNGGTFTTKVERECKTTLEQMRVDRARDIAR